VTLLITFLSLTAGFAILLYVLAMIVQSYLYDQPASWLAVRAIAGAAVAAGFLTLWVTINTRSASKDKYGTFFEFRSTISTPFDEFTATRRSTLKDATESPVKYKRVNNAFVEVRDTSKVFKLNASNYYVTAIEVPEGEGQARFEAELFVPVEGTGELKPWKPGDAGQPVFSREQVRVFREPHGKRYIEFSQLGTPGPIQSPSTASWFGAVALNALQFLVWFIVFWPILRFTSGVALGFAAGFGLTIMLFVMPILFEKNRLPTPPPAVARAVPCSMASDA
jgi:hypothetical protein